MAEGIEAAGSAAGTHGAAEDSIMPISGGDTWLVNGVTGTVWHVTNGPEAVGLEAAGWKAFPTQADAEQYASENIFERLGGEVGGPAASAGSAALGAAKSAAGGILGDLLPHFTSQEWRDFAIRAFKIVAGLALIIVGLVHLAGPHLPNVVPVPV
jgi:hypothetical protein